MMKAIIFRIVGLLCPNEPLYYPFQLRDKTDKNERVKYIKE